MPAARTVTTPLSKAQLTEQLQLARAMIHEAIVALQEGDEADEVLEDLLAAEVELSPGI